MNKYTLGKSPSPYSFLALAIFFALFLPAVTSANSGSYSAVSGTDSTGASQTSFTSTAPGDIFKLSLSDNTRMQTNGAWPGAGDFDESKYLEFVFNPNLPTDATIQNVTLTHEYMRGAILNGAKIEIIQGENQTNFQLNVPSANGSAGEISQTLDITNALNTPDKINNFRARFLAYRTSVAASATTSHDYLVLNITYELAVPVINLPPTADTQNINESVDDPITITLTGIDPENDSLVFHVANTPTKGVLGDISGDQVTYTPSGEIGDDSFTFTANDGHQESSPATVNISLVPGKVSSLVLSAGQTSLRVGENLNLTVDGRDKFGNLATNDNAMSVTFSADSGASILTPTVNLVSGVATGSALAETPGQTTFMAQSGDITSNSIVVEIIAQENQGGGGSGGENNPPPANNGGTGNVWGSGGHALASTPPIVENAIPIGGESQISDTELMAIIAILDSSEQQPQLEPIVASQASEPKVISQNQAEENIIDDVSTDEGNDSVLSANAISGDSNINLNWKIIFVALLVFGLIVGSYYYMRKGNI